MVELGSNISSSAALEAVDKFTDTIIVSKSKPAHYVTTDYPSDNACIQAAINYVNGIGGGSIVLREGTYTLKSGVVLDSNISITGINKNTTILILDAAISDSYVVTNREWVSGNANIHISNITINGNYSNQTAGISRYGVSFTTVSNSSIENCVIKNVGTSDPLDMGNGIHIDSCLKCNIIKNWVTNNTHYGIHLWVCNECIISENHSYANLRHGFGGSGNSRCIWSSNSAKLNVSQGFWFRNLTGCVISNNTISGVAASAAAIYGIQLKKVVAETTEECINNIIHSNTIQDINSTSVDAKAIYTQGHPLYTIISNNNISNADYGIYVINSECTSISQNKITNSKICDISDGTGSSNIKVDENYCYGCARNSIVIYGAQSTIQNNYIYDAGNETNDTYYGISFFNRDYSLISGNYIFSSVANKLKSGIYLEGQYSDHITVRNNQVYGNNASITKHALFGTSGGQIIISDNPGYNPVGAVGPPAVPASTVAYTNKYGYPCLVSIYGGTVTVIAINGVTTGVITGEFTLGPEMTLTITYSAVPTWVWWGL